MNHLKPATDPEIIQRIQTELVDVLTYFSDSRKTHYGIAEAAYLLGLADVVDAETPWPDDIEHFEERHAPHKAWSPKIDGFVLPREYLIECAVRQIGEAATTDALLSMEKT